MTSYISSECHWLAGGSYLLKEGTLSSTSLLLRTCVGFWQKVHGRYLGVLYVYLHGPMTSTQPRSGMPRPSVELELRVFPWSIGVPRSSSQLHEGLGSPCRWMMPPQNELLATFARVLVDLDMTKDLVDRILVEREGFAFFVDVIYERLPLFCSSCKIVGH